MNRAWYLVILTIVALSGCTSTPKNQSSASIPQDEKITVGIIQKKVQQGMTQTDVLEALGSPNIVTREGKNKETWVYDKIATKSVSYVFSAGIQTLVLGWGGGTAGGAAPGFSASSGTTNTEQRTLTVIIKFKNGIINDFTYHSSSF